jgi:SHS family lactate transporter-like MFS transporter
MAVDTISAGGAAIREELGYTTLQRASIIFSCMFGFALDLYDVLIMPFLMPSIQKSLQISLTQVSSVTSITLIGSVIGGIVFGRLGDKIGRRQTLQLTLALFSVGSIASAFAGNYWSLSILRFITGVGLGGEWGAGMVLFNEAWNKNRRGLGSAFIQGTAGVATAVAAIVGVWATTSFSLDWGWRIALLTGGSPIVLMIFVRIFVPESKAWQQFDRMRRDGLTRVEQKETNSIVSIYRPGMLATTVKCLFWMTGYMFCFYSIQIFLPALMLRSLSTPPEMVRDISVFCAIVGGLCYIPMGFLNDAFGRRYGALIPGVFWLGAAYGLYFHGSEQYSGGSMWSFPMFWTNLAFAIGCCSLGVIGTWLSEIYPIQIRSTAASSIYMFGRGIGSLAPVVVPLAAGMFGGQLALGMLVAIPAIVIFLAMTLSLPETRGRDLTA